MNYGIIVSVWLIAAFYHLNSGEPLPEWWTGYAIGATLVALVNILGAPIRAKDI